MPRHRILALVSSSVLAVSALAAADTASARPSEPTWASADSAADYSWRITPTGSRDEFRGLAAVSRRFAWVSGEQGTVLKTTTGGRRWRDVSPPAAARLASPPELAGRRAPTVGWLA